MPSTLADTSGSLPPRGRYERLGGGPAALMVPATLADAAGSLPLKGLSAGRGGSPRLT